MTLSVRRAKSGNGWTLVPSRDARDCAEDLDEVRAMIDAGEIDIAVDELRWLLGNCHELLDAHYLLGQLAVEIDGDVPLARGHFGLGYQLGMKALKKARLPTPVPALHPANRTFFDCGRGLIWCLHQLKKPEMALEIIEQLRQLDPADPLALTAWIDEIKTQGMPIVDVGTMFRKGNGG
ncbi:MAG: hypothetical protein KDA57_02895 [Planctomycetales bacterium]|nr:hypothetical protein [Planctomycetales bacterium]